MILLQLVASGIMLGGIYSLLAMGLALTLGIMRVVDMSYGVNYMLGGYITFVLMTSAGLSYPLAGLAAALAVFGFAQAVQRFIIRPIQSNEMTVMITTLAFAYAVEELVKIPMGSQYKALPPVVTGSLELGPIMLENQRLLAFAAAALLMALLLALMKFTKVGAAMRLVAADPGAAYLVGIPVPLIQQLGFGLGSVTAACGAVLLSPIFLIHPSAGWSPLLKAFTIVILGGLGSLYGTLAGAFLLAQAEVLTSYYVAPTVSQISFFVVLIVSILVKPGGLAGSRERVG